MINRFIEKSKYRQEEDERMDAILVSGGEKQLAALESMSKAEIKEWADAYKYNVPLSLTKAEMIKRFIKEADENYESEYEFSTSTAYYILALIGGADGAFVLAPMIEYFYYRELDVEYFVKRYVSEFT